MAQDIVLSVVAPDKPGLVDSLSTVIAEHDGNWLASSMARLGGQFAGIVQVDIPDDRRAAFEEALGGLSGRGIDVTVRASEASTPAGGGRVAHLSVTGADHPGIVRDISHALAELDVSIEQLHTQLFMGSMSGTPLFAAQADIVLPDGLEADELHDKLERIAADLVTELEFKLD
ncbi:glycine cleavage system protein R [Tepidamorphus sp. 3E244]|uniref:glycine cleavage system protein R n=1 Tax=Tepidamorphus sp. 3E244 TaxID=3385498 RepID=UPI0038FBEA20